MNVLRSLMLIGSLGKVWSRSHFNRNIFSSISIIAYFKLLDNMDNGVNNNIVIIPPRPEPKGDEQLQRPGTTSVQRHRERLKQTMRNVNYIVNNK